MDLKLVPGFDNLYLNTKGKAFTKCLDINNQELFKEISIDSTSQYQRISVLVNKKRKRFQLHVLMAVTFLNLDLNLHGRNKESLQIDHKDNNKKNNNIQNLEIVTKQENLTRAWNTGCYKNNGYASKGKPKKSLRKFTLDDISKIKLLKQSGFSYRKIAKQFNCNHITIYQIIKGTTYQDLNELSINTVCFSS
jgi:hypothetical protein